MMNRQSESVAPHTKEIFWKFAFRYFFHLRGISIQGGGQGIALLSGHQFTHPAQKALLPQPNHWVARL